MFYEERTHRALFLFSSPASSGTMKPMERNRRSHRSRSPSPSQQEPASVAHPPAVDTAGGLPAEHRFIPLLVTALLFALYWFSLAPGLTWAHQGADGAELLTAAITNGVPHPPGYPLYTLLLQGWLALLAPFVSAPLAGNLLSALLAAAAGGVATAAYFSLPIERSVRPVAAAAAGLAWGISPLLWSQALITEVYALHALLVAFLGWAALAPPKRLWYVVILVMLGTAHHLTFLLLLPAALWAIWRQEPERWARLLLATGAGLLLGALMYVRIPLAAVATAPVNWGYATDWDGFWWLISGAAYRGYLMAASPAIYLQRIAAWVVTLATQLSPVGLVLALIGLGHLDRHAGRLRTWGLLWLAPVSIYSIGYYTRDSEIYLLPVVWLLAGWAAVGLGVCWGWLRQRTPRIAGKVATGVLAALLLSTVALRWNDLSLAGDHEVSDFLAAAGAVLPPESIVVTLTDKPTFALWYAAYADPAWQAENPGITVINSSLYQFGWYSRLQQALNPDVPGSGGPLQTMLEQSGSRPIYFAEQEAAPQPELLEADGPLWRFRGIEQP